MISGASDEELDIAIARSDVLLELQPKIDELKKKNQKYKEVIDKANEWIRDYMDEWDINDEVWQDLNDLLILLEEEK